MTLEDPRHQEVHQRPQLHQVVLQRRARQQQSTLRLEVQQELPTLTLEVLDVLRLVEDEVVPLLPPEAGVVLDDELVASDADVEGVRLRPADPLQLPLLLRAVVREDLEGRAPLLQLTHWYRFSF